MIRKKAGDIEYLQFELFADDPRIVHAVFLRGSSRWKPEQLELSDCISLRQVHGKEVHSLQEAKSPPDGDGMITTLKGVGLAIRHADCQAAIFYDPVRGAIANVHAGWRGNVLNIYRETILKMKRDFGSRPEDLLVGISPSLGPQHAEFIHYKEEFPHSFWAFQVRPNYFDLWAIARSQLEEAGVLPHHIEIASLCTFAGKEDFFSYRRDKTSERNETVVGLVTKGSSFFD